MKALRPVASRLRLRSSTARRSKPLGKRNATARAVEGNLGGFCVWNHALVFVRLAHDRRFVGALLVCTESLNPGVIVMKSTKDGMRFDASCRLNRARDR